MDSIAIDLETLGVSSNAPILAIGAVGFNSQTFEVCEEVSYYQIIGIENALRSGATPDGSTIAWWMAQSDEARKAILKAGNPEIHVLLDFTSWFCKNCDSKKTLVWGNGSDFDNVILSSAFRRNNMPQPWGPFNNRCLRTLKSIFPGVAKVKPELAHHALSDAKAQAAYICNILRHINSGTRDNATTSNP